jgi:hypothetical protein
VSSTHERREAVEAALGEGDVRGLQILSLAMIVGLTMFTGLVVGLLEVLQPELDSAQPIPDPGPWAMAASVILLLVGGQVGRIAVTQARWAAVAGGATNEKPDALASHFVSSARGLHVLQMALWEGPGLFGTGLVFLFGFTGTLAVHPELWGLLAVPVLCIVAMLAMFPSRETLLRLFEQRVLDQLQD